MALESLDPNISSSQIVLEPELLKNAQAYLECRRKGQIPNGELTQAWERFYRSCDPSIRRFAVTCGARSVTDCTQEVWTTLIVKLGKFRTDPWGPRFSSWLYKLVRNKAVDQIRQRTRHPTESLNNRANKLSSGSDVDPAAVYEKQSLRAEVHHVLGELRARVPERSYRILYMHWIEALTMPEIAALLNLRTEQVWAYHHRAKQKFRRLFELHTERVFAGKQLAGR